MKHDFLSSFPKLSSRAYRMLSERQTLDVFDVLGEREMTAKEIANVLDKNLSNVWHTLRRLVQTDLLVDSKIRKRKGRPQKLYRVSSKKIFIPAIERTTTVGRQLGNYLLDSLEFDDSIEGEIFFFDGSRWRVEKVRNSTSNQNRTQEELWLITSLTAEERQTLATEIQTLFDKYRKKPALGRGRSLVHFAYAPYRELR